MSPIIRYLLLLASMVLILAPQAVAIETVTYCDSFGPEFTNWDDNSTLPMFDPSLGTLVKVELNATFNWSQYFGFEHRGPLPQNISVNQWVDFSVTLLDGSNLTSYYSESSVYSVTAYDGVLDFGGTSGFNHTVANTTSDEENYTIDAECENLLDYIATFPGETKKFRTIATAGHTATGSGTQTTQIDTIADTIVCVTYYYDSPTCIEGYKLDTFGEVLEGWNITLRDEDGTVIGWDLTNETGHWQICSGLYPCLNYSVCEILEPRWVPVDPPSGCYIDIEFSVGDNLTGYNFTNQNVTCIDGFKLDTFGNVLEGWTIFIDLNNDGILDSGEPSDTTDANGYWRICGLGANDSVNVTEVLKAGWRPSDPASGSQLITVQSNNETDYVNFTNQNVTCIDGFKLDTFGDVLEGWTIFIDENDNGILDAGELNDTTDAAGYWRICGINAGVTVDVTEILQTGWTASNPASGSQQVYVEPNDETDYVNFTNQNVTCIDGFKLDTFDNVLEGWTIFIDENDNGVLDSGELNDTTDAAGYWRICGIDAGVTVDVTEILQTGWTASNPASGSQSITVGSNNETGYVNFTNSYIAVCIDGHKYDYSNGKPLKDWNITAVNSTGLVVGKATTDENGYWQICDLVPDENHTVCEEQQEGWVPIDPPDGCYYNVIPSQNLTWDFYNDPRNITITKEADKLSVKRGDEVTYTITVCNNGGTAVDNVTVWDVFNRNDVVILSITPAPDPDGKWRFGTIPPKTLANDDNCRTIIIKIRVPERQDFEFGMEQGVSGEGFVNVANDYSTTFEEYLLKNCAYATSDWNPKDPISDCVTVTVGKELGTELSTRQYGSGLFDVEERVTIYTENKSIEWEEDLSAAYKPTSIVLYHNRTVDYDAAWVKKSRAKNRVTGTTMTETYHDAVRLDRESRMFLDENESVMEVNSDFDGRGHIGFLKMPSGASSPRATPIFEAREDYVGSFKVLERIDEYGSSVTSDKAAAGQGLVIVDKRVGSVQRTYESGTGTYDSEELIRTSTNYIAKDISLVHSPMSQRLTDSTSIDASMKWKEGIYSANPRTSYIGEEYTSITRLDKETVARGLNEMDTDAEFSGQARFRAILDRSQGGRDPEVDFDEQYAGDYSIERRVHLTGVSKYDRPHLNVTKTLNRIYVETLPWDRGEPHLEGAIKTRRVADYTIRIENDGNRVLQPVYVQDRFPPGATFIEPSSIRPSELTDSYANWTLTHLSIGGAVNISLSLDVSKCYSAGYPPEMVNRVEACGVYDDEQVCASNFSALEIKWLTCCLDEPVAVAKTAEIDPANPRVVRYRIDVSNLDDATRVATVTDRLPAGMSLIEASIPFASYEDGVVVWNILEIGPFETVTVEFSALASADGRFTNVVEVDPRSVEGTVVGPVRATCVIDVGVVEGECDPIGCGIWQPPNWQFDQVGYQPDVMNCELLTAAGCVGTGSCLAP